MDFLYSVVSFIIAIGLLITVHEAGHFWAAQRLGVKVLRFSVGFGKPIWSRRSGPDDTEYVVAAIPLGGYVKMLDEREGEVPEEELGRAFNRQSVGVRLAVVAAGPLANFIFAVFAFWLMFMIGVEGLRPIVDQVASGSLAETAGFRQGDEVVRVDGEDTATWSRVIQLFMSRALAGRPIPLEVKDIGERRQTLELDPSGVKLDDIAQGEFFQKLGITPLRPKIPPVIGALERGGPAERSGLKAGDRILRADGEPIGEWRDWVEYIRGHGGKKIRVELDRNGQPFTLELLPEIRQEKTGPIGRIGAAVSIPEGLGDELYTLERYGIGVAGGKAFLKTWEVSALTLRMLWKMLQQEVSPKNLSGPISIALYAGNSARIGIAPFLEFLAIVSVSLGILNLLPIPILDGGHLMYYLIELLQGRPVSEETQALGQRFGIALLVGLMGLAFYNDLVRLMG